MTTFRFNDTQDSYSPVLSIVGQEDSVECGVCGCRMNERRNVTDFFGFSSKQANIRTTRDVFECPHKDRVWHQKAIAIRYWRDNCPVNSLKKVANNEANQLVEKNNPAQ